MSAHIAKERLLWVVQADRHGGFWRTVGIPRIKFSLGHAFVAGKFRLRWVYCATSKQVARAYER